MLPTPSLKLPNKMPQWLPTTKKECDRLGWDQLDVILFTGDAYVDHPSFGAAVIGRVLEAHGYKVAIIPQPNWQDDLRDFRKLGTPRLFFGVSAGAMDSMVNRYTAGKRLRSEDAYTPDGRHTGRPEYPTIVYTKALKKLFPDVPVVIGGIEASLRRFTHYDYWQDKLMPNILELSGADYLTYGMGEQVTVDLADALNEGRPQDILTMKQVAFLTKDVPGGITDSDKVLASHEQCLADKRSQAANFRIIEEESNMIEAHRIIQPTGNKYVVVNPPYVHIIEIFTLFTTQPIIRVCQNNHPIGLPRRFNNHRDMAFMNRVKSAGNNIIFRHYESPCILLMIISAVRFHEKSLACFNPAPAILSRYFLSK